MLKIIIFTLLFALSNGCPKPEDLYPCTCSWPAAEDAYVTCSNLDNEHDLVNAASSLASRSYVYSFVIQNSIFTFIPYDAFKGLKFSKLEIINSSLMSLTNTDVAFEGLGNHLHLLFITNCTLMNDWDWAVFKSLKELTRFDVTHTNLEAIEDLGPINISKVMSLNFGHNRISFVHPFAFSSFKKLMLLSLSHNAIREVKRSMLPNPAPELVSLNFSDNAIEQFPSDMFTEMPQLELLYVANNKLLVLDEKIFEPVWQGLREFTALGNEIRCDCRLIWILEMAFPRSTETICAQPPELKGRNIRELTSKDLWCYK